VLEGEHLGGVASPGAPRQVASAPATDQLALFAPPNPIVERLASIDVNAMTPLDALTTLARLVEQAKQSQ
jgi:hypothetical protein